MTTFRSICNGSDSAGGLVGRITMAAAGHNLLLEHGSEAYLQDLLLNPDRVAVAEAIDIASITADDFLLCAPPYAAYECVVEHTLDMMARVDVLVLWCARYIADGMLGRLRIEQNRVLTCVGHITTFCNAIAAMTERYADDEQMEIVRYQFVAVGADPLRSIMALVGLVTTQGFTVPAARTGFVTYI